jgi:integrase/recombinase XerD
MKKKEAYAGAYKEIFAQFEMNLTTVNYSKETVYGTIHNVRDYLDYLKDKQIELIETSTKEVNDYFKFLEKRINKNTGLGLSMSYLQKIRSSLVMFYDFLQISQEESYLRPIFPEIKKGIYVPTVLSKEEIQRMFLSCDESLLGKRNKALLAIYYGCGLRRQEGTDLNIEDVDLNKGQVFIAKSKTRRQRNVPINTKMQLILEDYLFNAREKLIDKADSQNAVLITERGKRLAKETVVYILKKILKDAKITTKASPHTIRHSIATHLLQSGMKLENISLFLGHRSLDSTQIYTHLSNNNKH